MEIPCAHRDTSITTEDTEEGTKDSVGDHKIPPSFAEGSQNPLNGGMTKLQNRDLHRIIYLFDRGLQNLDSKISPIL